MGRPEEFKILQEVAQKAENPLDSEKEKVKVVAVEELIPEIKPREEHTGSYVDSSSGHSFDDSYTETFIKGPLKMLTRDKKAFEALRQRLKDQIVVDLGAGWEGYGYFISLIFGCKAYIGVEKFDAHILRGSLSSNDPNHSDRKDFNNMCNGSFDKYDRENEHSLFDKHPHSEFGVAKPELNLIPAAVEPEDALDFLKRLPEGSVSVFTFGLDSDVIPNKKYREELAKEIQRVLGKNGAYLSYESGIPHDDLKELLVEDRWGGTEGKKEKIFYGRASVLVKE